VTSRHILKTFTPDTQAHKRLNKLSKSDSGKTNSPLGVLLKKDLGFPDTEAQARLLPWSAGPSYSLFVIWPRILCFGPHNISVSPKTAEAFRGPQRTVPASLCEESVCVNRGIFLDICMSGFASLSFQRE
jgi:hypothetical protein